MAKRRRGDGLGATGPKGDDDGPGDKKKRKMSTLDPDEICFELYDTVRNYRDENGRIICESLIRVPKRRSSPNYYEVVDSPIDLLRIQQKLKTEEYEDVEALTKDMHLLFDNAMKYYQPDSQEYKDAVLLKEIYEKEKSILCDGENEEDEAEILSEKGVAKSVGLSDDPGDDTEPGKFSSEGKGRKLEISRDDDDATSTSTMNEEEGSESGSGNHSAYYEELVTTVLELRDPNGRVICELFKKLPPENLYPEYYAIIKEPIDLRNICSKIKGLNYVSIDEVEKDLMLLVKNAHTFNEPGSQIYKDATAIKKAVHGKRAEIEHTLMGAKSSRRLKARRNTNNVSDAITALLEDTDDQMVESYSQPEDEYSFEEGSQVVDDEGVGDEDLDNPLMMLFNEVYNHKDPTGRSVSEPFLRLPSRRAYPDYYEVISRPVALLKIRSQIKAGQYSSLEAVEQDLELCFGNAQKYNEPTSMLYKDAERLEELMRKKKKELERYITEKGIILEEAQKLKKKKMKYDSAEIQSEDGSVISETLPKKKTAAVKERLKKKKGEDASPAVLRKRMQQLYKAVQSYQDENGRYLSAIFTELPSAEEYPDYYKVITEPVCLSQIEGNIRENKYNLEEELLLDFEVMFENAKYYNEEDSQVHQDALTLEKVLKKKKKSLGPIHPPVPSVAENPSAPQQHTPTKHSTPTKSGRISSSPVAVRKYCQVPSTGPELKDLCKELFTAVKDCTDGSGRQLCIIFQKLPSRAEYPDYYTLIKKPIDMAKIASKLNGDQYQTLDEFVSDFCLMFDNACRYNDPDSQVYKDALTLQRELLRKKADLIGEEHTIVPNVQELVQKLLRVLYDSVMQHIDEEGRCFSDSLVEIKIGYDKGPAMTLASIGENLRKGHYQRMDRLQDDIFAIFEKARRMSRSDCETYDDAAELQMYWITQRDKLCKDGERFVSPAILATKRHLQQELDEERKKKIEAETKEDEKRKQEERKLASCDVNGSGDSQVQELEHGSIRLRLGDFVYVHPREEKLQPHIVSVEKLWIDKSGEKRLYGTWFYRPQETFHLATRKFLKKEVFRSDFCDSCTLSQVQGKCYVMFVKEYFRLKPEGFDEQDVFVCESRYNVRAKAFKKIKIWSVPTSDVILTPRTNLLVPERVSSVFAGRTQEPSASAMSTDVEDERPPDNRKNVVLENPVNPEEGCTYYEQFCLRDEPYKLGDSVYVRSEENYLYISRIDKIWTDRHGATWFHGPWFIGPGDTQHLPSRMFYDKEYFLSSTEETSPIGLISGKCCVLPMREYCRCRPTEIPEKDIYVNEARYDDEEMQFRKLKGLKRYTLTVSVLEDEYYFFEDIITPVKAPSPLLMDEAVSREERSISPASVPTESENKRKKPKPQSGYLLFSNEKRAVVRKQHPEYAFGEISRLVGIEWRNLTAYQKAEYEARAQMQPSHHETDSVDSSRGLGTILHVYDCMWQGCDYQYEDIQDLTVHLMDNATHLTKAADGFYHCFWSTCTREKRGMKPFNSSSKLFRHCREVHLKGSSRVIHQHERSKNFFPRHQAALQEPDPSPSVSKPTPQPPIQGPQTLGHSAGSFVGLGHGTSQALGGGYPQGTNQPTNVAANQSTSYIAGRLTPQSLQQGMFQGAGFNSSSAGISQTTGHVLPRQGTVGSSTVSVVGVSNMASPQQQQQPQPQQQQQPAMAGQQQTFQQTFSQPQAQFNIQQQMAQLQMQAQQLQAQQQQQLQQAQQQVQTQSLPQTPVQTQPQAHLQAPAKTEVPARPVFVAPPPRPQRLHHSEAYLRYIEGLRDGTTHMSNWSQARKPDARTMTPQQMAQLPVHWLGGGYGDYDNAVDALWALRDHMLKDALSLSKLTS